MTTSRAACASKVLVIATTVSCIAVAFITCTTAAKGSKKPSTACASEKVARGKQPPQVRAINSQSLINSETAFAAQLHSQVAQRSVNKNFAFSPFSIYAALSMVYAGARGRTADQIACVLQAEGVNPRGLHDGEHALLQQLSTVNQEGMEFGTANALWLQAGLKVRKPFLETLTNRYSAPLNQLDFLHNSETARKEINLWVNNNTRSMIPELFPLSSINGTTRLALANAVAMKGEWLNKFESSRTGDRTFHAPGNDITVPMMSLETTFGYKREKNYETVELPYKGDRLSMYVVLPAQGSDSAFFNQLSPSTLKKTVKDVPRTTLELVLPKFELHSTLGLRSILQALGVRDAFSTVKANLGGIVDSHATPEDNRLYVGSAVHQAIIKLDEEGTTAVAATGFEMMGTTSVPTSVVVDRPFLFLICDRATGVILFQGWIANPKDG